MLQSIPCGGMVEAEIRTDTALLLTLWRSLRVDRSKVHVGCRLKPDDAVHVQLGIVSLDDLRRLFVVVAVSILHQDGVIPQFVGAIAGGLDTVLSCQSCLPMCRASSSPLSGVSSKALP